MATDQQEAARRAVVTTPSDLEIRSERVFDAPRERVFAAWTDAEVIPQWWGLRSTTTVVDELDLRVGGAWRFVERMEDGSEVGFRGSYREVEPPERLAYSFEWEGMPGHVSVDILTFEDLDGRTRLTARTLFHTIEDRDGMIEAGMEKGMNETFDQLDELLAKDAA
jgi:uncharacterized protein YndB with AHSA1/START domain